MIYISYYKDKYFVSENQIYFTIDLQADAILTENWQHTTVISEAMLQEFTGVNDSSLKLHTVYSSYDYRSGWNAAWGLMKDVELVTNSGGVYLFSTTNRQSSQHKRGHFVSSAINTAQECQR